MTLTFGIGNKITRILPTCRMGLIFSRVEINETSKSLYKAIAEVEAEYTHKLQTIAESKLTIIDETRQAYKLCGKEPSRYRPSSEALLRRIRTGKGLYKINNIVDTINLLSISSNFSIGGFDQAKIRGDVILDIGNSDSYKAIGRGNLNIEHMPGLRDDFGFFGTPTSDSVRTMVTSSIQYLILVYYDFCGNDQLEASLEEARIALAKYCSGSEIVTKVII